MIQIESLPENWQENPVELFANLSTQDFRSDLENGTPVQMKLQIHDQLENEIFFPKITLAENKGDAKIEKIAVFQENLNIPENYTLVENSDFSSAIERKIYVAGRDEIEDHNGDKKKESFKLKVYPKDANLRVLQLYDVVGIFFQPDIIHCVSFTEQSRLPVEGITGSQSENIEDLKIACTQAMLGDKIAGQLLLAAMASEIYLRRDMLCLGKISLNLNIKNCEPGSSTRIIDSIGRLYPKNRIISMSLKNLNSKPFNPIKNYEKEILEHSELSIPDGYILILDETQLTAGKLTEIGTGNIGHINRLIQLQKLSFDYQYYQKDFDVKINTIIISEGKTVLPSDYKIVLKPDKCEESIEFNGNGLINRMKDVGIDYAVRDNEMAEQFIMETRKANGSVGVEDLHQIMVLARALSISNLEAEASLNRLHEARSIMENLKLRLET